MVKLTVPSIGKRSQKIVAQFGNSIKLVLLVRFPWRSILDRSSNFFQFEIFSIVFFRLAQHINKQCPNRPFVYERIPNYKLINTDEKNKEIEVVDRIDCQNKCLMEQEFTCRSSSFKLSDRKCFLSTQNRHVVPMEFKEDPEFEYLENMCLKSLSNFILA